LGSFIKLEISDLDQKKFTASCHSKNISAIVSKADESLSERCTSIIRQKILIFRPKRPSLGQKDENAKATPNGSFVKLELLNGVSKSRLSQ
jgi:hypothetical protein